MLAADTWFYRLPVNSYKENTGDLNPGFPPYAGRTPLAKVRNALADTRSGFAMQRTEMSRGRTGLAFLRTGIAFITIAVTFLRLLGAGALLGFDILLIIAGVVAIYDGLRWYIPVRRRTSVAKDYRGTASAGGVTVMHVDEKKGVLAFGRSGPVPGAEPLRLDWCRLSPVERRRFLANDRTDLAEERTVLASLRTVMARARTGLAFTRTGVAFAGLGIALLRKFPASGWTYFDVSLVVIGTLMSLEGFYWYAPGYLAGKEGINKFFKMLLEETIWDSVLSRRGGHPGYPPVKATHAPGIWGTTGLALERTVLADRRNVMSRLRAVMAHTRTGLAYIRTGMSICAVGAVLLVFLTASIFWVVFDLLLVFGGLLLVLDGIRWYRRSEKIRREFPYCFGDVEILLPDYGTPTRKWKKVIFSHNDL